jgi:amino acid adenylation domain-containing protein
MTSSIAGLGQSPVRELVCFPASFAQQSLWFIDQLTPGKATYNMPSALMIRGKLDVEVLRRTLEEVARRHETLRTRFVAVRGEPQQVIEDYVDICLPILDLTSIAGEQEREAEAMRLAREDAQQPFNLQQAPLFRVKLLRLGPLNHVLLLNMHHIISDAWSTGVLIEDVSALYNAFSAGRPSPLPELPIQYADYSVWQREWLEGGVLEQQLAYWKQQLAESSELALPIDRPRSAAQSQNGALYDFVVSADITQKLKKLAEEQGATLFMALLAVFQTLLYRYSGQKDIAVGTPTAGRNSDETEKLIGFFINTLVLRVNLSGSPSFKELLRKVKEVTLEAYAHQDVPFEKLVEVLAPERNLDTTPLFQVMLVLQNAPQAELALGKAKLQPLSLESGTAKFDLTMDLSESAGRPREGMRGSLEYNTDLFEKATVGHMIQHFQTLLEAVANGSERSIDELPLMLEAERRQLLVEWNDTAASYGVNKCVHELFEEQVRKTPDAPAVQYEAQQLTYNDLNQRANQLAHYLRAQGVERDTLVGICMERSPDMLVGVLGILKAGAAYLPLDPGFPLERLQFIREDAGLKILLTREYLNQAPTMLGKCRLINLNRDWEQVAMCSADDLAPVAMLDNLAYMIYTSGSTGVPKGVIVEHRQLLNQLLWCQETFRFGADDRILQKASFTFDVSILETLLPLIAGSQIVMAGLGGERDPDYLINLIQEKQVTYIDAVPTLLDTLLDYPDNEAWRSVRLVTVGGEALGLPLVRKFYNKLQTPLWNCYGPTETTIQSTVTLCEPGREKVLIGKPVANTQAYVVDDKMNLVPVGVPGELCLGGTGLARGYWGRGDLTAERFVPDGLSGRVGERLYRTGDLVRWLGDGNLEYLGRLDQQVKVRGFRIELGEIEAALQEHEGVRQAVVVAQADESGDKQLVAYVVAEEKIGASSNGSNGSARGAQQSKEWREHLQGKLPEYMVPSAYVKLESLPLNANGKIDRKRLPKLEQEKTREEAYVGPRSKTEETLCRLWEEVLKRERVGIHDNFFKTGGHSLRAAQVAARMRESFKVDIALRQMFESPTIAQLAAVIDRATQTAGAQLNLLPEIKRMARKAALLPAESR